MDNNLHSRMVEILKGVSEQSGLTPVEEDPSNPIFKTDTGEILRLNYEGARCTATFRELKYEISLGFLSKEIIVNWILYIINVAKTDCTFNPNEPSFIYYLGLIDDLTVKVKTISRNRFIINDMEEVILHLDYIEFTSIDNFIQLPYMNNPSVDFLEYRDILRIWKNFVYKESFFEYGIQDIIL